MRPEKLKFSGLRSYYGAAEVDFADLGLFAIIGDTGSGKSTIIEALGLALYARPTWSGHIEGLVSDGAKAWQVELTFVAGGDRWRVTRRRGAGSSVDKLERLDGGKEKVDGKAAVTERVEEIVGLNHSQFTSSVVLPQGQFEKLLVAKETERTQLLTSILGLDDLEATQRKAKELIEVWGPQVQTWDVLRRTLGEDPAGALEQASIEAASAVERAESLAGAAARLGELEPLAQTTAKSQERLGDLLAAVDDLPAALADDLDVVQTRWAEAAGDLGGADAHLKVLDDRVEALEAERAEQLGAFSDRDALVAAITDAGRIAGELPDRISAADQAGCHLAEVRSDAPTDQVDETLLEARERAVRDAEAAAEQLNAATSAHANGERLWRSVVDARSKLAALEAEVPTVTERADGASRSLDDARQVAKGARQAADAAATGVRVALVESAAAQAGEGCGPGDDCPVCTRPLPEDYVPPARGSGIDAAEEAERQAATALTSARDEVQKYEVLVDREKNNLDRLLADTAAAGEVERSASGAAAEAGVVADAADDDGALADLVAAVATARQQDEEVRASVTDAELKLAAARSEIDRLTKAHLQLVAGAEAEASSTAKAVAELVGQLDRLGAPTVETVGGGESVEPVQRAAALLTELEHQRSALDGVEDRLRDLADARRDANTTRSNAVERASAAREAATQMVGALRAHHATVAAAHDAAVAAVPDRTLPGLPNGPSDVADHDELGLLCMQLDEFIPALDSAVDAAQGALEQLAKRQATLDGELTELLERAGHSTPAELLTASGGASAAAGEAERTLEQCKEAAEKASRLDERLSVAAPFVANLRVLNEALRNNRFVAHLVATRQTELLAEASQRLSEITGGRFGFGEDFKVVNRHSGEQRRPDALSGGERFQAALALALALMEIASRGSRGRLEAVFIDEGFGSLDGAALEQALDRLRAVSGDGTTVALVSHLRVVAEHVNDVLHVSRDDTTGSQVRKLSPEELECMLDDDVRSGLTA